MNYDFQGHFKVTLPSQGRWICHAAQTHDTST